jgi:ubiquinone/menaquinone biosynthesis C-methylase UbiE
MTKETKKWWDDASMGYQQDCKIPIDIHYGPGSPNENHFHLLGNLKGKRVLEIGCGGAQCGIAMAKKGAIVTGIDISDSQLKFAKELAKKNNVKIKLIQGDIKNLKPINSNAQDIVFTAWALHYVDDFASCFKEAYRVLKKKGIFVLALPHPISRIIDHKTLKVKESYFNTGKWFFEEVWPDKKKHRFVMYNYTISQVFNNLLNAGFTIEKMIEPDSRKRYPYDPWYGLYEFKPKFLKVVPPTLIFVARK